MPDVEAGPIPIDADALRALGWLKRGKPQAQIAPDDATPMQNGDDLALFQKAKLIRNNP